MSRRKSSTREAPIPVLLLLFAVFVPLFFSSACRPGHSSFYREAHPDDRPRVVLHDPYDQEFPYSSLLGGRKGEEYYFDRDLLKSRGESFDEFLILIYFPEEFREPLVVDVDGENVWSSFIDGEYQMPPSWAAAFDRSRDQPWNSQDGWLLVFRAKDNLMIDAKGMRFKMDLHDFETYGEIRVDLSKPGVYFEFMDGRSVIRI